MAMIKTISSRSCKFLSTSIVCAIFMVGYFPNSFGKQFIETRIEKELTQYTISKKFECVIQQFIQEGANTFYKDGPLLISVSFRHYGINITGEANNAWTNACMLADDVLGYFTVSGHNFVIYGQPKYIENICFKGTQKCKFEMWDVSGGLFFHEPNISYWVIQSKDGQFQITEKYYDPN